MEAGEPWYRRGGFGVGLVVASEKRERTAGRLEVEGFEADWRLF